MAVLWTAGKSMSPAEVQTIIGGELAYNTVQTILIRLLEKELVRREQIGRTHFYWPAQDAAASAAQQMRQTLVERPDRQAVLQQFAATLDDADVQVLRALLAGDNAGAEDES